MLSHKQRIFGGALESIAGVSFTAPNYLHSSVSIFNRQRSILMKPPCKTETAITYVERMAREKAQTAVNRCPAGDSAQGLVILAADTNPGAGRSDSRQAREL